MITLMWRGSEMSKKILEIKGLTAGYKGKRIVDHVSFELYFSSPLRIPTAVPLLALHPLVHGITGIEFSQ